MIGWSEMRGEEGCQLGKDKKIFICIMIQFQYSLKQVALVSAINSESLHHANIAILQYNDTLHLSFTIELLAISFGSTQV